MLASLCVRLHADSGHHFTRGILRGVADFARVHGGWDFEFSSQTDSQPIVIPEGVRGVLGYLTAQEQAEALMHSRIPSVNVGNRLNPPPVVPSIFPDDRAVGMMAATYFRERGFQNFAFCGTSALAYSDARFEGFAQAVHPQQVACVNQEGDDPQHRANVLSSLPRPLAIFCSNDAIARMILSETVQLGIAVPNEIAVLGVGDDDLFCELSGMPLSSIRLNLELIGYEAAALLGRLMNGEPGPLKPILIPPVEVMTRRSTDVLALADVEVAAAVRFIRDQGGRDIGVEDLLRRTRLSRRSLEIRFRRAVGRSPHQEIRHVQLERAKLLLARTDRPVREIAGVCGFKEARQLSTAFHDGVGVTPRQYRRKMRGEEDGEPGI